MTRIIKYFPQHPTEPIETTTMPITVEEVEELKEIANRYTNKRIYKDKEGLYINYGRYFNLITE